MRKRDSDVTAPATTAARPGDYVMANLTRVAP
jgi:hypothetical protein